MKTTEQNAEATPVALPAAKKEITFLNNHQLDGKEVKKGETRRVPTKTADRLIAQKIAK